MVQLAKKKKKKITCCIVWPMRWNIQEWLDLTSVKKPHFQRSLQSSQLLSELFKNLQTVCRSPKEHLLPGDRRHSRKKYNLSAAVSLYNLSVFTVCIPKSAQSFLYLPYPTPLIFILATQDSCNSRGTSTSSPATDGVHRPCPWLSASQGFVLPLLRDRRIPFKARFSLRKWKERLWKYLAISNHKSLRKTPSWSIDLS